jgi:signal transduction histidine kinase
VAGRPWLGALGLRGRIVGVVLVTAVAALAAAAVALLGPLETSLRNADLTTLKQQVPSSSTSAFKRIDPGRGLFDTSTSAQRSLHDHMVRAERQVGGPIGASEVSVLGYFGAWGRGAQPIAVWPDSDLVSSDPFDDAARAFRSCPANVSIGAAGRVRACGAISTIGSIGDVQYARRAIPFITLSPDGSRHVWVLVVRKSLAEVSSAVAAVRTAFFVAALVALALALILGIPLSARIVRRLRVLRQAALRLAQDGPSSVEVPVDRARDEVGDLARTFALMQHQLQQQEEARRAFVATASHELRTPLATLDGMLELLGEDLGSGNLDLEDAQSLVDRARAQSRRLGRLAVDLLDLSRLDAEIDLRSEPVELAELSRAVLAEFELGTADRRIETTLDDRGGPVWALGDPGSVARILRILVENAVRVSPEGSEIVVELRNGDRASLSVCDHGPGVLPNERELIFERFQRGRETAGQAGFGLGLAIGRELAERMGGELVLEDRDPGARFTLRLPVAQAPDEEPVAVV